MPTRPPPRDQLVLDLPLLLPMDGDTNNARASFITGTGNKAAQGWIERWPDWPAPALVIWGPPASGKSLLAALWAQKAQAQMMPGGELALADALAQRTGGPAETPLRLVIDKAESIAGHNAREEALFHLYNQARDGGGHLLLLAEAAPAHWPLKLPDLRSRLVAAPLARIEDPDEGLLLALIQRHFALRQLLISAEAVAAILALTDRSYAGVREAVERLDRAALIRQKPITPALVRQILLPPETDSDLGL